MTEIFAHKSNEELIAEIQYRAEAFGLPVILFKDKKNLDNIKGAVKKFSDTTEQANVVIDTLTPTEMCTFLLRKVPGCQELYQQLLLNNQRAIHNVVSQLRQAGLNLGMDEEDIQAKIEDHILGATIDFDASKKAAYHTHLHWKLASFADTFKSRASTSPAAYSIFSSQENEDGSAVIYGIEDLKVSEKSSPLEILIAQEKQEKLEEAIAYSKLSDRHRQVIDMRLQGMTFKEIGDHFHLHRVSARDMHNVAIAKLSERLINKNEEVLTRREKPLAVEPEDKVLSKTVTHDVILGNSDITHGDHQDLYYTMVPFIPNKDGDLKAQLSDRIVTAEIIAGRDNAHIADQINGSLYYRQQVHPFNIPHKVDEIGKSLAAAHFCSQHEPLISRVRANPKTPYRLFDFLRSIEKKERKAAERQEKSDARAESVVGAITEKGESRRSDEPVYENGQVIKELLERHESQRQRKAGGRGR